MLSRSELLAGKKTYKRNVWRDTGTHFEILIESKGTTYTYLIDYEDRDLLDVCWTVMATGPYVYAYASYKHGAYLLHRVVCDVTHKGKDIMVDHINGDTFDNRRANLCAGSVDVNNKNTRRKRMGRYPRGTWLRFDRSGTPVYWFVQIGHDGGIRYILYNEDGSRIMSAREAYEIYINTKIQLGHYKDLDNIPTYEQMCPPDFEDPLERKTNG